MYLYLKNYLPKGSFQTITPCFRVDEFDLTHSKQFIKNELIKTDVVNTEELDKMVITCLKFFNIYLKKAYLVPTHLGWDIEYEGVELGSYGIRENEFIKYIYGTGCAEPRLSTLVNKII